MAAAPETDWRSLYPYRSNTVGIGGFRCHYVDEGEGPPVVMVHGNPTWSFMWRSLIDRLKDRHRVLAPDHIGMGLSEKPDRHSYDYRLARRIEDFTEFMARAVGGQRVSLVVHDWGGAIGLGWAVQHTAQVERLVILNTAAFHLPQTKRMPPALSAARAGGLGRAAVVRGNAFVRGALRWGVERRLSPAERAGYLAPYDTAEHRTAVLEFVRDIPLSESHPSHPTITAIAGGLNGLSGIPSTICWGMRDFVFDHHFLAEWQRRLPDAEIHRFPRAGHLVLDDAAGPIGEIVEGFVAP